MILLISITKLKIQGGVTMKKKIVALVLSLFICLVAIGSLPALAADDAVSQKDIEKLVSALKGIKFESLMYLSYQDGESGGNDYSKFALKRGYFTIKKTILPWFSARMTADISQVSDSAGGNNLDGSIAMRIKYLYGQFHLPGNSFLTKPNIEFGQVHVPWLDFEEHINYFRLQDPMFIERNHIFNSADTGVTFNALLGGTMDDEYQKTVNNHYPGRYGSVSFGIYNGGGYHASEKNENKVFEGRLTIRPLPDLLPGLQFSYLGITGKGNKDTEPDWTANMGFVSYEHRYATLTGTYFKGTGSQGGGDENDKDGYSIFAEVKPIDKFSLIGRYDRFDPNTDADNDENNRYIAGVAYMLDKPHKNMILLDYETVTYEQDGKPDDKRLQLTLQVSF